MKNYSQTLLEKFQTSVDRNVEGYACDGDIVLTNNYNLCYDLYQLETQKKSAHKTLTVYRDMDKIAISNIKLPNSRNNSIMMTINRGDAKDYLIIFSTKSNIVEYVDKIDRIINKTVGKKDKSSINIEISLDGEKQDLPFNGHSEGSFIGMFFDNLKSNLVSEQYVK